MMKSFLFIVTLFAVSEVVCAEECPPNVHPSMDEAKIVEKWAASEDDEVAKRIRTVAEKEEDPDLRHKLWVEYDLYRRGKKCGYFSVTGE